MTEQEYRKLDIDSYSTISQFLSDRKKYYRKYVLKEQNIEEEEDIKNNFSLSTGSLIDTLALTPSEFYNKYHVVKSTNIPKGQMLVFCNNMIKLLSNEVKYSYPSMEQDSYEIAGFKREKLENIRIKYHEFDDYILEGVRANGKNIVTGEEISKATRTVNSLLKGNNKTINEIMNIPTGYDKDTGIEVINQLIIIYSYNGFLLRSMIDKVIIDHNKKIIKIYDLKTTYSVDDFNLNYYKYKYYIQAACYWNAVNNWAKDKGYINDGYSVEFMDFIVCDSGSYMAPLLYTTDENHYLEGVSGFDYNNRHYMGLNEAIDNIKWHKDNNIWNMSKENYENNGVREIKLVEL